MISQADIIRILVNKNCTDESVMTTALSPDCTPPKLLEKLTEAERFDLAIDFSMKSGLDVLPLWKTWAMRCLKNRNFPAAREKFRHCFQRLRLPGGRSSPASCGLLNDILNELVIMDETKLFLTEEIEFIKKNWILNRNRDTQQGAEPPRPNILSRPKIFAECMHYLKEYGCNEDCIKFYIRNSLWTNAIQSLLDKKSQINVERFFLNEVVMYLSSTGQLDSLVSAFVLADPDVSQSRKYFKAFYNFCMTHRRYNLLHYVQTAIGDYVAAASLQINHFFLRKPTHSYRELNHRLSSLIDAREMYQCYLNKLETKNPTPKEKQDSKFLSDMPPLEVEKQIKTIDLQIEITRNFALNEVSGCINGIELLDNGKDNDSPVTLFEQSERRITFLAALVLIYFDVTCSAYFSKSGLDLANQLVDAYKIDKLKVFKTAMRIIIEDEGCDILENATLLLERLRDDYLDNYPKKNAPIKRPQPAKKSSSMDYGVVDGSKMVDTISLSMGYSKSPSKILAQNIAPKSNQNRQLSPNVASASCNNKTTVEGVRKLCDEVIRDAIGSCREPDYKMELAKLLSGDAKIELYIELGKLSNAQGLAFSMNRPDYVSMIIEEAERLNQNHVKTVCQLWLAKHETKSFLS